MDNFLVTRSIDIQYAHRVLSHGGHCAQLHGHRGTVEVTVEGHLSIDGPEADMVMDFKDIETALEKHIKSLLCHRTLLDGSDALIDLLFRPTADGTTVCEEDDIRYSLNHLKVWKNKLAVVVKLPFAPTAERLARLCYQILSSELNKKYPFRRVKHVRFWETSKSMAQYPA